MKLSPSSLTLRVDSIVFPVWSFLALLLISQTAAAHHVLGRPAYSLNEDSNTPSSIEVEGEVGDFLVKLMAYPAFPRPGETGRLNFFARHSKTGQPFTGTVRFNIKEDSWFKSTITPLGAPLADDHVFRHTFKLGKDGDYLVTAQFEHGGQTHDVELPLQVGGRWPVGPVGGGVALLALILLVGSLVNRQRLLRAKVQTSRSTPVGLGR